MRGGMSHLPLHVVLTSEGELCQSVPQTMTWYIRPALTCRLFLNLYQMGKRDCGKKWGLEEKGGRVFDFLHCLLLKPLVFVILSVSRPHRAFAPLQSKLWDVCLAQLGVSLTANSWGVGCEPSSCSWEDGSRFSIWVILTAKHAPSMVILAADAAGEKTGAQQTLQRELKAES